MKKLFSIIAAVFLAALTLVYSFSGETVSADGQIALGINAINKAGAEGHSLIITPSYGKVLSSASNGFCWWRSATFEWNDQEEAYIVRSVNLTADGTNGKNNYIPENGFVLTVNIGNDYGSINYINKLSSDCYNNLGNINVGDKAYLTGIDISGGTIITSGGLHYAEGFTSDAEIYIGSKPSGVEIYTPDTSKPRLDEVNLNAQSKVTESEGITVTWDAVENAEFYIVNVNTSTIITDGTIIANNLKVTDTTYTIPADKTTAGGKYTVSVTACAEGYRSSYNTRFLVSVVSDKAGDSIFKDKKIVAFGDSITYLPGWVAMLSGELGTDVINAGMGGDKTTEALARIDKDVVALDPDIVIVMFGMNDQAIYIPTGRPLVSPEQYEANYRTIIEKIHDSGAEVVLLTGNNVCTDSGYYTAGQYDLDYGTGKMSEYYDIIRSLAEEYNLNLIDMNKIISDEGIADSVICASGDGIHLSNTGKAKYAEWISDYMYDEYFENGYSEPEVSEEPSSEEASEEASEETSDESEATDESEESKDWITDDESDNDETAAEDTSSEISEESEAEPATFREKAIIVIITVAVLGILTYLCFGKSKKDKE
ncbi:MAG: SGNH/GDSL hydrolase family protein [Eubacteriales bacterium]|nr:SGNH/GDSL hydrolase family protein [Eubacteriales bacterium]